MQDSPLHILFTRGDQQLPSPYHQETYFLYDLSAICKNLYNCTFYIRLPLFMSASLLGQLLWAGAGHSHLSICEIQ